MISITTFPVMFSSLQMIQKYTERLLIRKDGQRLQNWILSELGQWGGKWNVTLKNAKYYIRLWKEQHWLSVQPLAEATAEKDLDVLFSNDLKVVRQCREAYSKANQILGLVRRTSTFKNPAVLTSLYKSLVRPHLENCSVIWSPHYTKDKVLLERVRHRFTRMFPELKDLPYEQRLAKL